MFKKRRFNVQETLLEGVSELIADRSILIYTESGYKIYADEKWLMGIRVVLTNEK